VKEVNTSKGRQAIGDLKKTTQGMAGKQGDINGEIRSENLGFPKNGRGWDIIVQAIILKRGWGGGWWGRDT